MSVKVEKTGKNIVKLEITVDKVTFEQGMEKSYKKNIGRYNIPGFRKGKAPRKMIEKMYGEGVFYEDAINFVCPEAYERALEQENIEVVDTPEIDVVQIGDGQDLIFSVQVTTKPEVKLGKYKGIEVEEKKIKITNDEIKNEIEALREKNSRIINVDNRAVKEGDITVIDFEGFLNGEAFQGGKGENYELTIGSGQFIPGFEEQLVKANIGDTVDVNVKFPEEYHSEDLSGKDVTFKVKINSIKEKELPKLDDEFAKDLGFDTVNELEKDIKAKKEEEAKAKAKNDAENEVIRIASDNAEIDIPAVMVDKQIDDMTKDFDMRLRYQGMDINRYMQLTGSSIEDFKTNLRPQAVEQVRGRLTLEAIAKTENIEVSEQEVEESISKLASNYKQKVDDFKKHLRAEDIKYIKEGIAVDKTIDFLIENSKTK